MVNRTLAQVEMDSDSYAALVQLYNNEINWRISCFYDAGYKAELGDDINGFKIGKQCFDGLDEAIDWLIEQAVEYYPDFHYC